MSRTGTIATLAALAIVVAALVGWRGARPTSPIATTRSDGVTIVPATGTLRREDAQAAPAPAPLASPTAAAAPPRGLEVGLDADEFDRLSARARAETRDPAWAPGAEARLRAIFADLPHLGQAPRIACAATLCEMSGSLPNGLTETQTNATLAALQGSAMARTRADFAENAARITQPEGMPPSFTVWLLRR